MPQSQRDLFKEFYKRIVTLGGEKVDIAHIFWCRGKNLEKKFMTCSASKFLFYAHTKKVYIVSCSFFL